MFRIRSTVICSLLSLAAAMVLAGCTAPKILSGNGPLVDSKTVDNTGGSDSASKPSASADSSSPNSSTQIGDSDSSANKDSGSEPNRSMKDDAIEVTQNPEDLAVLVNKKVMLPANYKPADLVEPNVPFLTKEKSEIRLMRKEAAEALERMFAAAKNDGIYLVGVSAYRSYETQKSLFSYYLGTQGEEARNYSAEPGHSEHQTGLAIDVSGSTGKCAAEDCFADTPEAKWLAKHAPEYGFIIRYPEGKEEITGYKYEPWHIRYVGIKIAKEIAEKGITLEEYLHQTVATTR